MKRALVDTGPLVAIFSPDDEHHERCVDLLRKLPRPLLSCWPVIAEAAWLLRFSPRAVQRLLESINGEFIDLSPLGGAEAAPIASLMKKYEDMRPQLADVALIYLAKRDQIAIIFTLDRRDFSVYQTSRKHRFEIVPEL